MFFVHKKNTSRCFQIHPVGKSVCEKLRLRDGLVWTVGLAVEIKLPFQIPPVSYVVTAFVDSNKNSSAQASPLLLVQLLKKIK